MTIIKQNEITLLGLSFSILLFFTACISIYDDEGYYESPYYYFSNGEKAEGNYTNNKREGKWKFYNIEHQLYLVANYNNNELDGLHTSLLPGTNTPIKQGRYSNNSKVGKWAHWYSNGQLKLGLIYNENGQFLLKSWKPNGEEMVTDGNGTHIVYENDIVIEKGEYKNGLKEGKWEMYKNNTLDTVINYSNGTPSSQILTN